MGYVKQRKESVQLLKRSAVKLTSRVKEATEAAAEYEQILKQYSDAPSSVSERDLGVKFVRLEILDSKMREEQEEFVKKIKQHSDAPVAILDFLKSFYEQKSNDFKMVEKLVVAGKAHAGTQSAVNDINYDPSIPGGSVIGPLFTLPHRPSTRDGEETGSEWSYTDASGTDGSYTDRTDYTA